MPNLVSIATIFALAALFWAALSQPTQNMLLITEFLSSGCEPSSWDNTAMISLSCVPRAGRWGNLICGNTTCQEYTCDTSDCALANCSTGNVYTFSDCAFDDEFYLRVQVGSPYQLIHQTLAKSVPSMVKYSPSFTTNVTAVCESTTSELVSVAFVSNSRCTNAVPSQAETCNMEGSYRSQCADSMCSESCTNVSSITPFNKCRPLAGDLGTSFSENCIYVAALAPAAPPTLPSPAAPVGVPAASPKSAPAASPVSVNSPMSTLSPSAAPTASSSPTSTGGSPSSSAPASSAAPAQPLSPAAPKAPANSTAPVTAGPKIASSGAQERPFIALSCILSLLVIFYLL